MIVYMKFKNDEKPRITAPNLLTTLITDSFEYWLYKLSLSVLVAATRWFLIVLVDIPNSSNLFPEQDWLGAAISIGGAVLRVESTCPRCSMTTHGFDDLPRDTDIMRNLVTHSGGNLGIYASVITPGEVAVGDHIGICLTWDSAGALVESIRD